MVAYTLKQISSTVYKKKTMVRISHFMVYHTLPNKQRWLLTHSIQKNFAEHTYFFQNTKNTKTRMCDVVQYKSPQESMKCYCVCLSHCNV